ncbi:FG-GAP repeat [Seminavis robusta]|uniref:FG-GAP repeat n=1 Tax=Seminavis robusta TaxID=568900 RepID=A0A9N8EIA8_9STRA|nr:FG-GAP repeat [Seminavis robusta]|eukprot:Sro1044_g234920.1 FG-GAP repeat (1082) ;mRNA; r:21375-26107
MAYNQASSGLDPNSTTTVEDFQSGARSVLSRRLLKGAILGDRSLQSDTLPEDELNGNSTTCTCPLEELRIEAFSKDDFLQYFNQTVIELKEEGLLQSVRAVEQLEEGQNVECGQDIQSFTTAVFVEMNVKSDEAKYFAQPIMEDTFKNTYNALSYSVCDGVFSTINESTSPVLVTTNVFSIAAEETNRGQFFPEVNVTVHRLLEGQQVECGSSQKIFSRQVSSGLRLNLTTLSKEEVSALEQCFQKTYNNLAFEGCDGQFRTLGRVQLQLVQHYNVSNQMIQDGESNVTGSEPAGFTGSEPAGFNTTEPQNVSSLVRFLVNGTCRNCNLSDTCSFALFDESSARALAEGQFDPSGLPISWNQGTNDVCVCPFGTLAGFQQGPSVLEFLEAFLEEISALIEEGVLVSVEQLPTFFSEGSRAGCSEQVVIEVTTITEDSTSSRNDNATLSPVSAPISTKANTTDDSAMPTPSSLPSQHPSLSPSSSPTVYGCPDPFATVEAQYVLVFSGSTESLSDLDLEDSFTAADAMLEKEACDPFVLSANLQKRIDSMQVVNFIVESMQVNNNFMYSTDAEMEEFIAGFNSNPRLQAGEVRAEGILSSYNTVNPSGLPSFSPSDFPSLNPSIVPSQHPSTVSPSNVPSHTPSKLPTTGPSSVPSTIPSGFPSTIPSLTPSREPSSTSPSETPSTDQSENPSTRPSHAPSTIPSNGPSVSPSQTPSSSPSNVPTFSLSHRPSVNPSSSPSLVPSVVPSQSPSVNPSTSPSNVPSGYPSSTPTKTPTKVPTRLPTRNPTQPPTRNPTKTPTEAPTKAPTQAPTKAPTGLPTRAPTKAPTKAPTQSPTEAPTRNPTKAPTKIPTPAPTAAPTFAVINDKTELAAALNTGTSFQPIPMDPLRHGMCPGLLIWQDAMGISSPFAQYFTFNEDISLWDVSSVTTFSNLLLDAPAFNQDLNSWDVSKSTDFFGMFSGAISFNGDISSWNVAGSTTFLGMFQGATFNRDISSWDVSNALDFSSMFATNAVFNIDIAAWNVGMGTTFDQMFSGASAFDQESLYFLCLHEVLLTHDVLQAYTHAIFFLLLSFPGCIWLVR